MVKKKASKPLTTPDLVPWMPPGKDKKDSFNVNVNKSNKGIYDLSASQAANAGLWNHAPSKKPSTESSPWAIRWLKDKNGYD